MDAWEHLTRFDISDQERAETLIDHLSAHHNIHLIEDITEDLYSVLSKFHGKIHTCPREVFLAALRQAREERNG